MLSKPLMCLVLHNSSIPMHWNLMITLVITLVQGMWLKSHSQRHLPWRTSRTCQSVFIQPQCHQGFQDGPSIPTSTNTLSPADKPSPVKVMKTTVYLQTFLIMPHLQFPSSHHSTLGLTGPSSSTPVPPAMHFMTTGYLNTVPKANTTIASKVAQTLLQGMSAWIVSDNPGASSVVFKLYCTPFAPSIKLDIPPIHPYIILLNSLLRILPYVSRLTSSTISENPNTSSMR